MVSSAIVTLKRVQARVDSEVATSTLWYPAKVNQDTVHRLETARLVLNERRWFSVSIEPLLQAEVDPKSMWTPRSLQLELLSQSSYLLAEVSLVFKEYMSFYTELYDGSR